MTVLRCSVPEFADASGQTTVKPGDVVDVFTF
jgi:hypothetical protein